MKKIIIILLILLAANLGQTGNTTVKVEGENGIIKESKLDELYVIDKYGNKVHLKDQNDIHVISKDAIEKIK